MDFGKLLEHLESVKFKGGMFSGITIAVTIICFMVLYVVRETGNIYVISGTIILVLLFAFYIFKKLFSFADRNPELAILSGAEFLKHQRIIQKAKGQGVLPEEPNMSDLFQTKIDPLLVEQEEVEQPKKIGRQ